MKNKSNSVISKGWLIIGIVLLIIGSFLLILVSSLSYETSQLDKYIINEDLNGNIKRIQDNIDMYGRFLVITAIITIIIGAIMIIECFLFSRFLKRFEEK